MRSEDWKAALAIRDRWNDPNGPPTHDCPIFTSPATLLQGIVRLKICPGNAISSCPLCGGEHRWALLKQLLIFSFDLVPRGQNRVLDAFYQSMAEERERYGGDEGYRKTRREAEAFFARNPTANVYLP